VHGLKPKVQRDVAILENRAHLYGKWLPALVALVDANPGAIALEPPDAPDAATMRTVRAFRPNSLFDIGIGRLFVVEMLGLQNRLSHD
jgi:hypothetical protein